MVTHGELPGPRGTLTSGTPGTSGTTGQKGRGLDPPGPLSGQRDMQIVKEITKEIMKILPQAHIIIVSNYLQILRV